MTEEGGDGGKGRKGIFKKKSTSSSITSVIRKAPSVSSVYDDQQEVIPKIHTIYLSLSSTVYICSIYLYVYICTVYSICTYTFTEV